MTATLEARIAYTIAYNAWQDAYEEWLDALDDPHLDGFAVAEYAERADGLAEAMQAAHQAASPGCVDYDDVALLEITGSSGVDPG